MNRECEESNCGSRIFRVGEDGYTYCSEGHRQLQAGLVTAEDEGQLQTGRRTIRRGEEEDVTGTALTGKQAVEHYLLCFQLVLWRQVHWLINKKDLPAELETIVRDLWALRIQTFQDKIDHGDAETEADVQLFSSQSEAETSDEETMQDSKRPQEELLPRVVEGLSLNYLGMLLLRLPIAVLDIHEWASSGDLVYYRAVKILEPRMRSRLPGRYHTFLDPQYTLQSDALHAAIMKTLTMYHSVFGMNLPAINYHLCLYRLVQRLLLPLECYAATIRLAELLDIEFRYSDDDKSQRSKQYSILRLAEGKLVCLLVLATKLLFAFDDRQRYPRRPTELAALGMNWVAWSQARSQASTSVKSQTVLSYADALSTSERDVLSMSDDKLDQYMDWYEDAFVEEQPRETGIGRREAGFRRALFDMFPIDRGSPISMAEHEHDHAVIYREANGKVQSALRPLRVVSDETADEDTNRPGSHYRRYRRVDVLAGHAAVFYQEAAQAVGLPLKDVVQGVFGLEKRLEAWESKQRNQIP